MGGSSVLLASRATGGKNDWGGDRPMPGRAPNAGLKVMGFAKRAWRRSGAGRVRSGVGFNLGCSGGG